MTVSARTPLKTSIAATSMTVISRMPSHRVNRKMPMLPRLNRFFAARPRRTASPARRRSNRPAALSQPAEVVDDPGAVAEEQGEELQPPQSRDQAVDAVAEAIQRIHPVRRDEQVQHARRDADGRETDERRAEEHDDREDQRLEDEA